MIGSRIASSSPSRLWPFLFAVRNRSITAKPSASDGPANALTLNALEHQLLAFFRGMSADHRDDLIVLANRWFIHDNPGPPSVADPYPKQRKKAKA